MKTEESEARKERAFCFGAVVSGQWSVASGQKGDAMRMWEWWRKVEEEYREKRRREDEQRAAERRGRGRGRTAYELQEEARGRPEPPLEELLEYMEREWGVKVDWEEWGMTRPKPRGIQVEVVESQVGSRKSQGNDSDRFARGALMLVLTGRFGIR